MTGFEPRSSGIRSDHSTNWATTTAQVNSSYNLDIWWWLLRWSVCRRRQWNRLKVGSGQPSGEKYDTPTGVEKAPPTIQPWLIRDTQVTKRNEGIKRFLQIIPEVRPLEERKRSLFLAFKMARSSLLLLLFTTLAIVAVANGYKITGTPKGQRCVTVQECSHLVNLIEKGAQVSLN